MTVLITGGAGSSGSNVVDADYIDWMPRTPELFGAMRYKKTPA